MLKALGFCQYSFSSFVNSVDLSSALEKNDRVGKLVGVDRRDGEKAELVEMVEVNGVRGEALEIGRTRPANAWKTLCPL